MKNIFKFLLGLIIVVTVPVACSNDDDSQPTEEILSENETVEEEIAYLSVKLVDAPGDYQQVNVDLSALKILLNEESLSLSLIHGGVHDLLEFTGGGYEDLVYAYKIPPGNLTELELVLGDDNYLIMADETTTELNLPDDLQGGLAVALDKELQVGDTLNLVMDFNTDESVILREDEGYDLIPVLRVSDEAETGHIWGYMAQELEDYPALIWVIADSDTIKTQTYYGDLMLWGLPPGTHDITFNFREDSGLEDLIISDVEVIVGERTDIGPLNFD